MQNNHHWSVSLEPKSRAMPLVLYRCSVLFGPAETATPVSGAFLNISERRRATHVCVSGYELFLDEEKGRDLLRITGVSDSRTAYVGATLVMLRITRDSFILHIICFFCVGFKVNRMRWYGLD
jgi:hypothetical protein